MTLEDIALKEKGSIISGPFGSNISSKFFVDFGVPVIRGNNLTEDWNVFVDDGFVFVTEEKAKSLNTYANRGDLIFTAAGTIGQVGIIPEDSMYSKYVISNKQLRARLNEKIVNPKYAYYWFSSTKMNRYIKMLNTGSTIPLINLGIIRNLPIPVPTLYIQNRIVCLIESIENKIKVNYAMNKTIEEFAQSIFKRWFVDFEFPTENGEHYNSSGGRFVDSELGMIPEGWEIKTIDDVSEIVSKGTTPTKKDMDTASDPPIVNFIKVRDINEEGYIKKELERIPKSVHEGKLKRSILKEWDILFSIAGTIGRVSSVTSEIKNSNTNQAVAFIRLNNFDKTFGYIFNLLKTTSIQNEIHSRIVQGVQANVSLGTLKGLKFPFPDEKILSKFNNTFISLYFKKIENYFESQQLVNFREILLHKLMSGVIQITDEEQEVEQCLQRSN